MQAISIGRVISTGYEKLSGFKGPYWIAQIVALAAEMGLYFVCGLLLAALGHFVENKTLHQALSFVLELPIAIISLAMYCGILFMGIHHLTDKPYEPGMVFKYFHYLLPLAGAYISTILLCFCFVALGIFLMSLTALTQSIIIISLISCLGIGIILFGIYLYLASMFCFLLIIDKEMSIIQSIRHSIRIVSKQWFKVPACLLLIALIGGAGMILLLVGLIWTMPWATLCYAHLYRELFDDNL